MRSAPHHTAQPQPVACSVCQDAADRLVAPDTTSPPTVGSVECSASERSARRRRWARCSRSRQMVGHGQRSSVRGSTATQHIQHSASRKMQRSMQRRKEQARDNKRALLESTDWANVACGCVLPSSAVPAYAASACPVPAPSEQQSRQSPVVLTTRSQYSESVESSAYFLLWIRQAHTRRGDQGPERAAHQLPAAAANDAQLGVSGTEG
jgi:hypothetical protein